MKRKRPSRDPLFSEKSTVIFLDLLGFADLIRQKTEFYNRPDAIQRFYTSPSRSPGTLAARDVRRIYQAFHAAVRSLVLEAQRKRRGNRPLTSIIFSDSLYVFFETPDEAVDFARVAMQRMIRKSLTVRIGVGWGTADRLNFTSETFPSGDLVLSAPFLGTGVVNAYRAESCGVRGMRILVHDSVAYLLKKTQCHRLVPLPRYEATESTKHEINYLNATGDRGSTGSVPTQIRALGKAAPARAKIHYRQTLRALARMARANMPSEQRKRRLREIEAQQRHQNMVRVAVNNVTKQFRRSSDVGGKPDN